MLKRILIPLDGSETAEQAIPVAERFLSAGAEAILVRAVECPLAAEAHYASILGELERTAIQYLALKAGALARRGFQVETRLVHGDPAGAIVTVGEEEKCDLVVMSTHGRRGMRRFLLGSVTEKVVRHCPLPVMTVRAPGGAPPERLKNVLVPLDGSKESEGAIAPAVDLAKRFGAKVVMLHVLEPIALEPEIMTITEDGREALANERLEALAAKVRAAGAEPMAFVRWGDASEEILRFVEDNHADLICMTTHGRSGVVRWLMGSVAERVLRHSPVPVYLQRLARPKKAKRATG